ncbi:MAG: aminopeptidase P family protein [bacterium]|nr:aminopeptidase P family protein [bacterium]
MDAQTYSDRRTSLRSAVPEGAILILGNTLLPKNYVDNHFPLRQDSHFLYYVGVNQPDLALLILPDGSETLYGNQPTLDDFVWCGVLPSMEEHGRDAGVSATCPLSDLRDHVSALAKGGTEIRFLPPYSAHRQLWLANLLDQPVNAVADGASAALVQAVVDQRSLKTSDEIAQIEEALGVTAQMYRSALAAAKPGATELEIVSALRMPATQLGRDLAFQPIVSVRGEILHNTGYSNRLAEGDLLLIDSGAESMMQYASDITRTFPVSATYSDTQREIYTVVLNAQKAAIEAVSPEMTNREVHMVGVRTLADGLKDVGLMKGDVDEAVAAGAHALFMPHGIGHMMGLDVHDMEDLGDVVGYPEGEERSKQFGLGFLRLAKRLEPGFVITIEPGVYFNPALVDRWQEDGLHRDFIAYDKLEAYTGFGGIRIEDDVLVTENGHRVLGPGIPKEVAEIEGMAG